MSWATEMQALCLNASTKNLSLSYFFSKCGEFAFETAFAVAVVTLSDTSLLTIGIVYFFRYLPCVLFSPVGGWLADNCNKKRTLVMVELAKCGLALALFAVFEFSNASILVVIIISMAFTALDCLYAPTFRTYFSDVVDKESLCSVNSGVQVIEDVSSILGPLVFSAMALLLGSSYTFIFFSTCLMASVLVLCALSYTPQQQVRKGFNGYSLVKRAAGSIDELRMANAQLFSVVLCTAICAVFATSVVRFILPASVLAEFQSEAAVGYVMSLLAAGTVFGGISYMKLSRRTAARSVPKYWTAYGVLFFMAAILLEVNIWGFLVVLFFVGFMGAFVDIAIVTNIQCLSKGSEVGRNFSLYYFTAVLGDALSGLVASLVFAIVGSATFLGMTLMLLIAPLRWMLEDEGDESQDRM